MISNRVAKQAAHCASIHVDRTPHLLLLFNTALTIPVSTLVSCRTASRRTNSSYALSHAIRHIGESMSICTNAQLPAASALSHQRSQTAAMYQHNRRTSYQSMRMCHYQCMDAKTIMVHNQSACTAATMHMPKHVLIIPS